MSQDFGSSEIIENEYASVSVTVDGRGNDRRLAVLDNHTGQRAYFDALILESLVWVPDHVRDYLLDPSTHRWASEPVQEV